MSNYVYLYLDLRQYPKVFKGILAKKNKNWGVVLDYLAKITGCVDWEGNPCRRQTMRLVKNEANRLLDIIFKDSNNKVIKRTVSLKQIRGLEKPLSGKSSCHAGIILMAIFNLICKAKPNEDFVKYLQHLRENFILTDEHDLMTHDVLGKEQSSDIKMAFQNRVRPFEVVDSIEFKLGKYFVPSIDAIMEHQNEIKFLDILTELARGGNYVLFSKDQFEHIINSL